MIDGAAKPFSIPRRGLFHIHTPPFTEHRKSDLFSDVKSRKSSPKSHRSTNDRLRSAVLSPLVGYMRVSKADGSQVLDLQKDALTSAGVPERNIYSDTASGKKDDRPGLDACLKAVRTGDTLVIWKLDRLGRNLRHLVNVVHDLNARGIGHCAADGVAFRQRPWVRLVVTGAIAMQPEFGEDMIRRGGRVKRLEAGVVAVGRHGNAFRWMRPRPSRPSWRSPDGGRTATAPLAAVAQRRTAGGDYFGSRCKAPPSSGGAAENSRRTPLRSRAVCRSIALSKAGRGPDPEGIAST